MKNIKFLFAILFMALSYTAFGQTEAQKVELCSATAGPEATYMKDFVIELQAAQGNEKSPSSKYSFLLTKDTRYRFTICTDDDSPGKGVIQLFDSQTLMFSSFNPTTGKEWKQIDIDIQKTSVYHLFINFHEGKAGKAVVIISLMKRL